MYAVLETGSKQYRVSAGDTLEVDRLAVDAGQAVNFDRVLLVNNDGKVTVGAQAHPRRQDARLQDEAPQGLSQDDRASAGADGCKG